MKIGITGPIASGKSSVSEILSRCCGATIIDADSIGRYVTEHNQSLSIKIAKALGNPALALKKGIDRAAVARIVFQNPRKLQLLNSLIHPLMLKEIRVRLRSSKSVPVILDAALLLDWDIYRELNGVLLVTAKKSVRIKRLLAKGLSAAQAADRIRSQKNWEAKEKKCDWKIQNNGTPEELREKVLKWWSKIV